MLKIYGTMKCPDCVECCAEFDKAGIEYEFLEFYEDMKHLKAFLKIRDHSSLFDQAREEGNVGIPCIITEDGSVTLDWRSCLQ